MEGGARLGHPRQHGFGAVEMAFVSPGQTFDPTKVTVSLDFGALNIGGTSPRQVTTNLQLRSNKGYAVTVQSQNRGVLRMGQGDPSAIPYAFTVNGAPANLSGGVPARSRRRAA